MTKPTKLITATLGAAVVLTMGALTAALGNSEAHAAPATNSGATVTTVQSTPPSAPAIPVAVPSVKAQKFVGKDWNG
jgi:hypothetical protein